MVFLNTKNAFICMHLQIDVLYSLFVYRGNCCNKHGLLFAIDFYISDIKPFMFQQKSVILK